MVVIIYKFGSDYKLSETPFQNFPNPNSISNFESVWEISERPFRDFPNPNPGTVSELG